MIAVVIPSFRTKKHILGVLEQIGPEVGFIYVVDDCCPEFSGKFVEENVQDPRVKVLYNPVNLGVGGAVCTGYRQALIDKVSLVIKIDGDGQMDPKLLMRFAVPILSGEADYTKGNRFFHLSTLLRMPTVRLIGNSGLSLINKFTSGYWNVIDPTNGYTAISYTALALLPLDKLETRYFFESDMLFRLGTIRAVVLDVPMDAVYQDEVSNLRISAVLISFPQKYAVRAFKRLLYCYFLRDINPGTLFFVLGFALSLWGAIFGYWQWQISAAMHRISPTGTVMLAVLPIVFGFQLLLSAVNYDLKNYPKRPLSKIFRDRI